jgi:hypothetical protein
MTYGAIALLLTPVSPLDYRCSSKGSFAGSLSQPLFTFTANASSTTVSIQGTQGIAYIGLDNVSVVATTSVPEPTSLVLGTLAAIVVGGITWLRRKPLS